MIEIYNVVAQWWTAVPVGIQFGLIGAAAIYLAGAVSKFTQYELFCRQSFSSFRATVLLELAEKHKLNSEQLATLLSPLDTFVAKYSLWAILMAVLWPIITPMSLIFSWFAPRPEGVAELAGWMSGMQDFELWLASITRFSFMSHNETVIKCIAMLSVVSPELGADLRAHITEENSLEKDSAE